MFLHNKDLEKVGLEDITNYLTMLKEFSLDDRALMVKCIAFRKLFDFYNRQGITHLDKELIPIIEGEYKPPRVAKPDDYYKVLAAIPNNNDPRHIRNKAMLMLFKDTGMRLGELLSLDISCLDLENRKANIITEKSHKAHPLRTVFWFEETNEALKKWLTKRTYLAGKICDVDPDAVFISATGVKAGRRLMKSGGTEAMRRLSKEAGLKYIMNSHSLRHLFGHDLGKDKVNQNLISVMMGHADPSSSYPYTILNSDEMSEIHAKAKRS